MSSNFFIVPRPGFYGDTAAVRSSHRTAALARSSIGANGWANGWVVREGALKKGNRWLRVYEEFYPIAKKQA